MNHDAFSKNKRDSSKKIEQQIENLQRHGRAFKEKKTNLGNH
jgi:hypothetical protein